MAVAELSGRFHYIISGTRYFQGFAGLIQEKDALGTRLLSSLLILEYNKSMDAKLILLVDDDAAIRDVFSLKLGQEGYRVIIAENGLECVNLAKEKHPDLILLDLKMPVMDGAQALAKLREDPATRDIKVIFLTSYGDPSVPGIDEKFAKEAGAMGYMKKDVDMAVFSDTVRKALEQSSGPTG